MSLPCCLCSKCQDCKESFLCSKAFGIRIGLSLVAAAALVVAMNLTFPHLLATLTPDSYSVTGHPMDRTAEGSPGEPARTDGDDLSDADGPATAGTPAQDS